MSNFAQLPPKLEVRPEEIAWYRDFHEECVGEGESLVEATSTPDNGQAGTGVPSTVCALKINGSSLSADGSNSIDVQGTGKSVATIEKVHFYRAAVIEMNLSFSGRFTAIISVPPIIKVSRATMKIQAQVVQIAGH